ncbi:MAG: HAMP domain-containing histidine kinase [Desulfobacterales bacterium]|nr:HAMP domain-containing histidine kinase [Desulfobacterales bacterium]
MKIEPVEMTRVILLVSPACTQAGELFPNYEDTITFKSLSYIAKNKCNNEPYYYWLIYTDKSKETAEYIDRYFSDAFGLNNQNRLHRIPSIDNAEEICNLILQIASEPKNENYTVYCDCTGGTKTMSIAMSLACNHYNLISETQTHLVLTFVPPEAFNAGISFYQYNLSRIIQQQNHFGRMQYLARFSSILAHEIKNPLNLINADLYLLGKSCANEYSQQLIREMERSVNEITQIIDNVRQVVRGEADASLTPAINLNEVMRRLKIRTKGHFPSLNFVLEGDLKNIRLKIAEEKLYTVFTNLIENAAKATHGTGTVIFKFRLHKNKIAIDVSDNGPGIPDELRSGLFKPMRRGININGTGMGLHIMKVFVTEEGGTICYDENYTQGARFLIELPLDISED